MEVPKPELGNQKKLLQDVEFWGMPTKRFCLNH